MSVGLFMIKMNAIPSTGGNVSSSTVVTASQPQQPPAVLSLPQQILTQQDSGGGGGGAGLSFVKFKPPSASASSLDSTPPSGTLQIQQNKSAMVIPGFNNSDVSGSCCYDAKTAGILSAGLKIFSHTKNIELPLKYTYFTVLFFVKTFWIYFNL